MRKTIDRLLGHLNATGQSTSHVSKAMLFLCEEIDRMEIIVCRHTRQIHDLKYNKMGQDHERTITKTQPDGIDSK